MSGIALPSERRRPRRPRSRDGCGSSGQGEDAARDRRQPLSHIILHWLDLYGDGGDCVNKKVYDGFGRRTPLGLREKDEISSDPAYPPTI